MGKFELLFGEARDGCPVYQQAHSRGMPNTHKTLLYRSNTKDISPIIFIRSKDEWVVKQKGDLALKASVEADSIVPPTIGWLFPNEQTRKFEEDTSLTWNTTSASPPCCLTLTLSGPAKETQGHCEGEYKSMGLTSMGREVKIHF